MIASLLFLLLYFAGIAVYTLSLRNTLLVITPANRTIAPGMVWLLLIPAFNLAWHFVLVHKLSDSITKELRQRTGQSDDKPAYGIGIIATSAVTLSSLINVLTSNNWPISVVSGLIALFGMICGTIYWIRIIRYKQRIEQLPPYMHDSIIFNQQLG